MRLCRAKGNEAIFHCWEQVSYVVPPAIMRGGAPGGEMRYMSAVVELASGQVTSVMANDVVFTDTKEVMSNLREANHDG